MSRCGDITPIYKTLHVEPINVADVKFSNTLTAPWLLGPGDEGYDPNYVAPSPEEQKVYRTVVVDGVNGPMEVGYHGPVSRGEQIKAWHMNLKNRIVHHDAIKPAPVQATADSGKVTVDHYEQFKQRQCNAWKQSATPETTQDSAQQQQAAPVDAYQAYKNRLMGK